MTQEIINVGDDPNDGLGDPLRAAFDKINNNFSNLFSTVGSGNLPALQSIDSSGDQIPQNILNIGQLIINSTQVVNAPQADPIVTVVASNVNTDTPLTIGDPEIINVGDLPNDGTGDPLRTAFDKINNNFSNLFSTVGGSFAAVNPIELDSLTSQNVLNIGEVIIRNTQVNSEPIVPTIELTIPDDLYSVEPRIMTYNTIPTVGPVGDQEYINIGAQPNDGEGDPLRVAFGKINNNFTNLFLTTTTTSSVYTEGLTPDQVIFEYPADQFTQAMFQIRSSDPGSADSQGITISAQINNSNNAVKFTGYGITFTGNAVSRYDMDVTDGNVRILSTPLIDTYVLHFISSEITFIGIAEPGIDIGLDGYVNSVLGTEDDLILTTEGP